jgi:hypothetical protein
MRPAPLALIATILAAGPANADAHSPPWRISVYGGTATRLSTSEIFLNGHFHPDGSQVGISLDRDLADLGSGFTFIGEVGATRFVAKSNESSLELGLGVRYDFDLFGRQVGFAAVTGPSWATDEPVIPTGTFHGAPINFKKAPWLNYVSIEIAVQLAGNWSGVMRYYHRSGAFGIFERNADEGSTLGFGLQYRF